MTIKTNRLLATALLALSLQPAQAAGVICKIDYAGATSQLQIEPSDDPYRFASIEPGGNFRFSAQLLAGAKKLKTYVYHDSKDRLVLVHAAEYPLGNGVCQPSPTGLNRVYSSGLERELTFRCRQACQGEQQ